MTRKDYHLIAAVLCGQNAPEHVCRSLATAFANDNPKFDIDKFLEACGID